MKRCLACLVIMLLLAAAGCGVVRDTPKYSFNNGYYSAKLFENTRAKAYVENVADSIYVYLIALNSRPLIIDTVRNRQLSFARTSNMAQQQSYVFRQTSFDIDLLTTPFKIRPATKNLPTQFTTNLNGVVYLGYRSDLYELSYQRTPLNIYNREISHYGFSFGGFSGFGGTDMSEHVTESHVTSEYSGVVWSKGVAGIIAVNNITIGLALGWDNLLDNNRQFWIYQGKPWIGFAFGLNLN